MKRGFRSDSSGGALLGPDAAVLLDEEFAAGYCFRVADPDPARTNQVGLAFSPAARRAGRVDINGVLWIDSVARRLVDLDYRFVGLGEADALRPRGRTSFQELPTGLVTVDRWSISLPESRLALVVKRGGLDTSRYSPDVTIENGGDVLSASWADGSVWAPVHPGLRLNVSSRGGGGIAGLRVALVDTDYSGVTDVNGEVVFPALIPGDYRVSILDSRLPVVNLAESPASRIAVAGDTMAHAKLFASSLSDYAVQRCRSERRFESPDAPLIGYVVTQQGEPAEEADVTYGEPGREALYRLKLRGSDGIFAVCLGPTQRVDSLELKASKGALRGSYIATHGDSLRIATVRLGSALVAKPPMSPLRGVAFDSLRAAPLVGALVALDGNRRTAISDANGAFAFDSVDHGDHSLTIEHDLLDAIGISRLSARHFLSGNSRPVELAVPSYRSLWRRICGRPAPPIDSSIVIGTVRIVGSPRGVAAASINAQWQAESMNRAGQVAETQWSVRAESDSAGGFALCGLPTAVEVRLRAERDSSATDLLTIGPLGSERIVLRNLTMGSRDSASVEEHGVVTGVVMRDSTPVSDVRVGIAAGVAVRTSADGRFTLSSVPAGTRRIEARAIGLTQTAAVVDVQPRDTVRVVLRMSRITTLDSVVITAEAVARRRLVDAFVDRRRTAVRGYFRDSTTIGKHLDFAGVFSDMPSVTFRNPRGGGVQVMMRAPANAVLSANGSCAATVWVDRVRVMPGAGSPLATMRPEDIAAVEVYPTLADTPFEFGGAPKAGCGTVVVWTKRAWP